MKQVELFNDNYQNFKVYGIPHAQLIIADIPYNIGVNAYASNPAWYKGGDNKNGESELAGKEFFDTDKDFRPAEFMHFCSQMLVKEPKNGVTDEEIESEEQNEDGKKTRQKSKAPCMIIFCAFEQMQMLIEIARKHGYMHYIPLIFCKNYSAQVLKANMRICGATEYALVFYRDKLPKFNNGGHMVFNWFEWKRDSRKQYPKIHPTQKPVGVLKRLIEIFTDEGDVVIDPVAGSGSTLRAAQELGRNSYGFETNTKFFKEATEKMLLGEDD